MLSTLTLAFELGACAMLKDLGIDPISSLLASVFIFIFTIAFYSDLSRSDRLSKYQNILFLGYLLRIALLFFDRYGKSVYQLPNSGADSEYFYIMAVQEATGLIRSRSGGFIGLFRIIFSIIGTNRLFAQFLTTLFSIVALCAITITIDEQEISDKAKSNSITALSFLPNYAILSSIFLRESIVSMCVAVSLLCYIRYYRGGSFFNLAFSFACVVAGMVFHSGVAGLIIGYLIVMVLHNRRTQSNSLSITNTVLAIIFGFGAVFLYVRYGEVFYAKMLGVNELSDVANTLSGGGSSYATYVGNSNSAGNMVIYTIPRIFFFLFSPFPWQWRGIADIIAFFFSGLYYLYIVTRAFRYLRIWDLKNKTLVLNMLIITICAVFVFAWGVSNTGTAARHRDKLVTLFAFMHALTFFPEDKQNKIQLL